MGPKGQRRRAGTATGRKGRHERDRITAEPRKTGPPRGAEYAWVVPPRAPWIASGTRRDKPCSSIFVEVPATLAPRRGSKRGSSTPYQGPDRGNEHHPLGRVRATGLGRRFGYPLQGGGTRRRARYPPRMGLVSGSS